MIQKLLFNTQMRWMKFTRILKNTTQIKNEQKNLFDDAIAEMLSNKKHNPIVTELFIRGRKLNISLTFITQKNIRLNSTYSFVMKIPNKKELQQIACNHSSDIDF